MTTERSESSKLDWAAFAVSFVALCASFWASARERSVMVNLQDTENGRELRANLRVLHVSHSRRSGGSDGLLPTEPVYSMTERMLSLRAVLEHYRELGKPAQLQFARLDGLDLDGVDLRGANLNYAILQGAEFEGAWLEGATFRNARIDGAYVQGVDFRVVEDLFHATFTGLNTEPLLPPGKLELIGGLKVFVPESR